jgi:hypothetical protein
MPNNVWIHNAEPEEQGSFCDRNSGHQYNNTSGFGAVEQARSAEDRGDKVTWLDKSIAGFEDERPGDAVQPDDRYNIHLSEEDSQGGNTPSLFGPGR